MPFVRLAIAAIAVVAWTINLPAQDKNGAPFTKDKENDKGSAKVTFPFIGEPASNPKTDSPNAESPHWYASPEWWLFIIGVPTLFVFGWQAFETRRAAEATRDSVNLMERQAEEGRGTTAQQMQDVQASIAESTRASKAMEKMAEAMAESAASVKVSVAINREIADRQKLVTELQSRAYLTVMFDTMVPQNIETGIRFQPHMQIKNLGNTPAYDIRFNILADVVPFPIRDEFAFPLPVQHFNYYASTIGPGLHKFMSAVVPKIYPEPEGAQIAGGYSGQRILAWGIVRYRDAFQIERTNKFGFTFYALSKSQWMSQDTQRNNETD